MSAKRNSTDWRAGTKRRLIGELAEKKYTKRQAFNELRPLVESEDMVFAANVGGRRRPKPIAEQLVDLKNEIGRVYKILGRSATAAFEAEEIEEEETETEEEEETAEEIDADDSDDSEEEETEEETRPVASGKEKLKKELAYFLSEVRRIRTLCESRAASGAGLDWISMRPVQAAANLIPAGIPANALLHAMALHWKPEIRRESGIADFDYAKLSRSIMESEGIDPTGKHELFGYILRLAENRQAVMLIGPAGTGKSHIVRQISEYLELPYGETPMTAGATRGDLLGRMTANPEKPFILSQFAEMYGNGGVFNFEEIDAADPGMLIVLNNALASNTLFNSSNGERYDRSDDFVAFATANTFGIGANRDYTGRERLDAATIDRWRMGRVYIGMDETIEEEMLYGRI
jgi:hypothetical protein